MAKVLTYIAALLLGYFVGFCYKYARKHFRRLT